MSDYTPEQIRDMLSSLEGENRLDSSSIKNIPIPKTDAEIQALIDATIASMIIPSDEHILSVVSSNLIKDDEISSSSLWSSYKVGEHIYTTPALYKKPYFISFSMDLENEVPSGTDVGGARICSKYEWTNSCCYPRNKHQST